MCYQRFFSVFFVPSCRFNPTCSSFAIDAIKKYGVFLGVCRSFYRLLKCHPYSNANYHDPA